jgi:hypothetical protein
MLFISPVYLIMVALPSMLIAFWAQAKVKSAMAKYSRVANHAGLSGAEAAEHILRGSGVNDVTITTTRGWMSDHYDPTKKELRLSPDVHEGRSLAAVGIAAHEAGHALQQAHAYAPLMLRSAIVPMAAMSNLAWPILIAGIIFKLAALVNAAVILFLGLVVLQVINLPVEYNASRRARTALLNFGIVSPDEDQGVKAVLNAAALTYVAAALGAILQLLYFIGLARRN